jgi:anaerobic selenocysteine-containing dehydrogenase
VLEFLVVSDLFLTPTGHRADLVLPAATWLEQDDVVNMHKIWCVLARKKVAQVGETRDDREVMIQLAQRLGLTQAFPWETYRGYLEWVLDDTGMSFDEFCERGIIVGTMRYYKYRTEGFKTPSGKFDLYSNVLDSMGISPLPVYREPPVTPLSAPNVHNKYSLILTCSGKVREFFHSEGRQIALLRRANPDPLVQIHPDTALHLKVADGDWVWIETPEGRVRMRARLFDGVAPDVVAAQYGWWFPENAPPDYGWKESSLNLLYGDMAYEPETGSESLRSVLCKVYPVKEED